MATNYSRETFISNIVAVYRSYQLDGIEIDWEYPGHAGSSSNTFNTNDTANFLLFLRSLRAALPPGAKITAAVEPTPFVDDQGRQLEDVSEFAEILDWVLIMNYDLWGCELFILFPEYEHFSDHTLKSILASRTECPSL